MRSTNNRIQDYQNFFMDQAREAESERLAFMHTPMSQLFRAGEITIGTVEHLDDESGHMIIQFPKNKAPRLKVLKSCVAIKREAKRCLGNDPSTWACTFVDFSQNVQYRSEVSDLFPLSYIKKSKTPDDYVVCAGVSSTMYDRARYCLQAGKTLEIIVFAPLPPIDYYINLAHFMKLYPHLPELLMEPKISYEKWHPEELAYNPDQKTAIPDKILDTLRIEPCCILQGPPGTGKSFTIAHIAAQYLANQKTVCVTTMGNKGLVELVQQPPLTPFVQQGKISKSNLTEDEKRIIPGLQPLQTGFAVPQGEMACFTNYALSKIYSPHHQHDTNLPLYDLVIIEEASQAFLTSILAFRRLGWKCLIVGDPMQLPPAVSNPQKDIYNVWNANTQINGLQTFALGSSVKAFRITTTFRLTPASAKLTGLFYNNRFTSVQQKTVDFHLCPSRYFPPEGGSIYHCTMDYTNDILSHTAADIISEVIRLLHNNYPDYSLVVIAPFIDTVKQLQKLFQTGETLKNLTIETIDRIQGITVDYAILYIPGRHPAFALDEKRFNVATSRSVSTTLILSDVMLENLHSVSPLVKTFIRHCRPFSRNRQERVSSVPR